MRPVAIGPLQLCVGLYCVALGALMLITPHQFLSRSFAPWQLYLTTWGSMFLLAGCLLFGAALVQARRFPLLLIHLFAGGALLSLAMLFVATRTWTGLSSYALLGFGTLVAPLLARRAGAPTPSTAPPIDLFTLVMGVTAVLLGLLMLGLPDQFSAVIYTRLRPYLLLQGLAFLIGGIALIAVHLRAPRRRTWVVLSHVLAGSAFLAFGLAAAVPARSLSGIAYYGGMGLSILLLPWLRRFFAQFDPTRLQTRLALALIALSALPLIFSVALISEREAYTATQQTLARERMLARNLARNTNIFVTLHRSAANVLAGQLSQAPPTPEAHTPLLQAFQAAYPEFRNLLSYNVAGEPIARSVITPTSAAASQPAIFNTVRDTRQPQIAVGPSRFSTAPVFIIGAPLFSATGSFTGVVVGVLDSAQLAQMWIESAQIAEGEVYLVDAGGRVIASPTTDAEAQFADRSAEPPVAAALAEQQVGSLIYDSPTGARLSSYAPVPELNWSVIIDRPAGVILSGLRTGQELTFGILLAVVGIAAIVSVFLARSLSVPLAMLARATRTIAHQEASTPLPQSSIREVSDLAEQFAELRTSLQQRTAERDRAEQRLQLLADAGNVLAASLDANATLQQIAGLMIPALGDWGLIYLGRADERITLTATAHNHPEHQEIAHTLYTNYPIDPRAGHGVANVLRTGRPEVVTGIDDELLAAGARDAEHLRLLRMIGFHSVMVVPLNARGRTIGALVLVSSTPERTYTADDLALAEDLAQRAALAADNALLYAAERDARDVAETALHARDRFLSIAAHELRTPLTALLGQAQLIERRLGKSAQATDRDRRAAGVVVNQAQRLDHLITTLFDLNRLQTGQITLQLAPCDLAALVRRLAEELQPTLANHQIELEVPTEPVSMLCDELRMEQILQNLVQNAIKYSPDGGVVAVQVALTDDRAVLQVRDEGIGIPEESLPYLFEPFFRAANAERSVMQGMGVGLGVVKELVQLHGGSVSVVSVEGRGSTFTVSMPYTRREGVQQAEQPGVGA